VFTTASSSLARSRIIWEHVSFPRCGPLLCQWYRRAKAAGARWRRLATSAVLFNVGGCCVELFTVASCVWCKAPLGAARSAN